MAYLEYMYYPKDSIFHKTGYIINMYQWRKVEFEIVSRNFIKDFTLMTS